MRRRLLLAALLGALLAPGPADARPPHRLLVDKSARRMTLFVDGEPVKRFRIALGGAPAGDKRREGDQRTPEGRFSIGWKNRRSRFHLFFGLSYPAPRHARRAHAEGRIGAGVRERIEAAHAAGEVPPQRTPLGGFVGIHGGGAIFDWTLGCIAVSDAAMDWLDARVRVGDRVDIVP